MPGSTLPISQLDWLISTTAMIVLSWSRATRDLLKSFGWGIRALHQLGCSDDGAISSSPAPYHLAGKGFEPSVPFAKEPLSDLAVNIVLTLQQRDEIAAHILSLRGK